MPAARLRPALRPGAGSAARIPAPGADGAALRPEHGRGGHREGGVRQRGPRPRCDPQLQRRRFDSLYPRYRGGRPPKFTLPQRREIKKLAKTKPAEHGLPFSTWSLSKLADFLVAAGVVDDISHEGLRILLREEGVTFQRLKTWKGSTDPECAQKKARIERLYAIADGEAEPPAGSDTCSPPTTWAATSSTGTSGRERPAPAS